MGICRSTFARRALRRFIDYSYFRGCAVIFEFWRIPSLPLSALSRAAEPARSHYRLKGGNIVYKQIVACSAAAVCLYTILSSVEVFAAPFLKPTIELCFLFGCVLFFSRSPVSGRRAAHCVMRTQNTNTSP